MELDLIKEVPFSESTNFSYFNTNDALPNTESSNSLIFTNSFNLGIKSSKSGSDISSTMGQISIDGSYNDVNVNDTNFDGLYEQKSKKETVLNLGSKNCNVMADSKFRMLIYLFILLIGNWSLKIVE